MNNECDKEPEVYSVPEPINPLLVQLTSLIPKLEEYIPLGVEYHNSKWNLCGNKIYCMDTTGCDIWVGEFRNIFTAKDYVVLYPVQYGKNTLTLILNTCDECSTEWVLLND